MQRRALLAEVSSGMKSVTDVCDAHPDLVRAGENIGEVVERDCPICDADELRQVTYAFYGRGETKTRGRALRPGTLRGLVEKYGRLELYVVEVCPSCEWHHLVEAYPVQHQRAV